MTATELVQQRVHGLSETQVQMVLAYIDLLESLPSPSASELMRLPVAQRRAFLVAQAAKAEALYRNDSNLICDDVEAPLSYG